MAQRLLKGIFGGGGGGDGDGGQPQAPEAAKQRDADFADFAAEPEPAPEAAPSPIPPRGAATLTAAASSPTGQPWTKWYRIQDRHSISEFKAEGVILSVVGLIILLHLLGARVNRAKARAWIRANAPVLRSEFALVGFGDVPTMDHENFDADSLLREKSLFEFATYATGRQNAAFLDVKLTLAKRFNPIMSTVEAVASVVSDLFAPPTDVMEAVLYPFDGKEELTVPMLAGEEARAAGKDGRSTYEGFVWAIVHKERMQKVREDRYDVTLTSTRDNAKLPGWLTVMTESPEITEALLTKEVMEAVVAAGDWFEYLIISDQPTEKPKTLEETTARKRLFLRYRLPGSDDYSALGPLLGCFARLPDLLVRSAQFRPEVVRKVKATREAMAAQLRKAQEEERAEERLADKEKSRKAKRDAELKGLDAKAQKKYLEKEREKEMRRSQKKMTMRG
ncbi:hypothetical protein L249_2203 [Ophiocordyceps polyrhachis-furcata BCC 54312]|uniref:DUF1682 domain-containing protein n=1 Tax=Ophiocordyceps polyrhachis-furcata BCC 54312 TaxID=1330021 RepID=A0A367LP12_9HYPO|nr:hypothetical protein L249_2203 [Ophiocordyceps polyrhachis-furcata BCC 54312]